MKSMIGKLYDAEVLSLSEPATTLEEARRLTFENGEHLLLLFEKADRDLCRAMKERFEAYSDMIDEWRELDSREAFISGFSLGMRLAIEAFEQ